MVNWTNDSGLIGNLTNTTNVVKLFQNVNDSMGSQVGISVWLMIVIVVFLSLLARGYKKADCFAAASFVGFISSLLLMGMSLIPDWILWINIFFMGVAIVMLSRD